MASFQRVSVEERARRYIAAMPPSVSGQNGHLALFNVVRALLHGFDFTPGEARPFLDSFNARCDPPWSEGEINHKLRSVQGAASKWPRGYLRNDDDWKPTAKQRQDLGIPTEAEVRRKVEFELEKLQRIAAPWREKADLVWLANRSTIDPATVTPAAFLKALYGAEEKVLCFTNEYSQGEALWPDEVPPAQGPVGVWFLPQPVTGQYVPNPEGKPGPNGEPPAPSRRIGRCVTAFRYLVIESDSAPMKDWLGFIVQAPLQIEALYTSGSRSIHALVRLDARTYEEWHAKKNELMPFLMACIMVGGDRNTFSTAVRLSRLPGALRLGKMETVMDKATGKPALDPRGRPLRRYAKWPQPGEQKLLYLRPGAAARPICEITPVRDVEQKWLAQARAAIDGHAENTPELRAGLRYYARQSESLRAALRDLEETT